MYSVIVPIYKVEKYLPQCIESILAQTCRNFELILVDDGSPDNCPLICDEYAKKDDRVKVVHKVNGGLVSARKAGLKVAQGEYICFVDGDDFISKDMLEVYEQELRRQSVDIICTGYSSYYGDHKIIETLQPGANRVYSKNELQKEIYPRMLSQSSFFSFYIFPSVWSKCIKRSIAETVYEKIPNEISLGEDVAVTYPVLWNADSISILDYSGYMYRQNPDSMTHTYDKKLYEKIRNLVMYLKSVEKDMKWQAGNQINEYAIYLLILAKNNEFKYNKKESYRNKKRNMQRYLNDPLFKEFIQNARIEGWKNKFMVFCFKTQLLMPINVYETILQKEKCND